MAMFVEQKRPANVPARVRVCKILGTKWSVEVLAGNVTKTVVFQAEYVGTRSIDFEGDCLS